MEFDREKRLEGDPRSRGHDGDLDRQSPEELQAARPGKRTLIEQWVADGLAEAMVPWSSAPSWPDPCSSLDDFRVRGLHEVLAALTSVRGGRGLLAATSSAARNAMHPSRPSLTSRPAPPDPVGEALWRATERRAATLYRRAVDSGDFKIDDPAVDQALARIGAGQAMPAPVQRRMELELDASLDRVRIHTDSVAADAARAVQAKAFTVGEDIFFADGAYAPDTAAGQQLLAHELTHVVQAYQGRTETGRAGIRVSRPDESLEREADTAAARIGSARGSRRGASSPSGALQPVAVSTPAALLLRTPQPGQPAIADRTLAQTSLAVTAGGRSYRIGVVHRGGLTLIVAQLSGTAERLDVPLPSETAAGLTATFGERVIQPDRSSLDIAIGRGGNASERRYRVEVVPSPYEAATAAGRPDRVRISNGAGVVEKDLYPAGSANRLSPRDVHFSTVARLPPSGRSPAPVNIVVEVSGVPTGRGAVVTLNLQKTGQRRSVPIDVDLGRTTVRLVDQQALAPDAMGNPQVRLELEVVDNASQRTVKILQLTFISWVNTGTVDEGYTYAVTDLLSGATDRDGFLVPPSTSGDFHVRTLTNTAGAHATVSEDQAYNAQLSTASAGGITLHFRRDTPTSTAVRLALSLRGASAMRDFTMTYPGAQLRPRIVEDTGGDAGRLVVSLDGNASRDLLLTWNSERLSGQYPFLEGFDHVVLRNVSSTRIGLNLVAPGIEPWSESWYNPPLPDDCITPPRWRRIQLGAVNGWMRDSDRRFIRAESVDTQVAGAQMGELLAQEYAIGYIHSIPFVGEAVMIGEAAAGREIVSGRRLDRTERTMLALFGGLGAVLQSAAALRGLSGEARAARLAAETGALQRTANLSETEARALLHATDRAISPEERTFLEALKSDVRAGRAITTTDADRLRAILTRLDQELQAQRQILGILDARMQQIQAARGDLNVFRARFRTLTGFGNAPQDLTTLAARLDELLTPFRRVRVVTGGGRAGTGVSTYIEALDGRFSIRVTHNQVGPAPVGNPPAPRIHIYDGVVSGHGTHIVLPNGTTLDDILRALGLL